MTCPYACNEFSTRDDRCHACNAEAATKLRAACIFRERQIGLDEFEAADLSMDGSGELGHKISAHYSEQRDRLERELQPCFACALCARSIAKLPSVSSYGDTNGLDFTLYIERHDHLWAKGARS